MLALIINAVVFDVAWLLTVTSAAQGLVWMGPLFTLFWLVAHLYSLPATRRADMKLCAFAALFGYGADSLLVLSGLMSFPSESAFGTPSTVWMVFLWINLALTLNHSLFWLRHRYVLATLLGVLLAPPAYLAGEKLGALILADGWLSLTSVAIVWLISMPLLIAVTDLLNHRRDHFQEMAL